MRRGHLRPRLALLACLLVGFAASVGRAQSAADGLSGCLEQVLFEARRKGGRPAGRLRPVFLMAPDATQLPYTYPEDSCVGFLAVGRRQVQELRLTLYRADGEVAAAAPGTGAYAYARVCQASGTRLMAHVEVLDGSGEVQVLPILNAPAVLPRMDEIMASCAAVGQPRALPLDVGPEPIPAPLGQRLRLLSQELAERGYRPLGESVEGVLGGMRRELRSITLPEAGCSAVALVPDGDMEDVELRILSGTREGETLDHAFGGVRPALVKVCSGGQEQHMLDIRAYGRGGHYLLQVFRLEPPARPLAVPGLSPVLRAALWETVYRLKQVGMVPRTVQWVLLPARSEFRAPVQLDAGQCYALSAVAGEGTSLDDVDLTLSDALDNHLAGDVGPRPTPLVFTCPQQTGLYAAHLRAPDLPRSTRALLLVATPPDAP